MTNQSCGYLFITKCVYWCSNVYFIFYLKFDCDTAPYFNMEQNYRQQTLASLLNYTDGEEPTEDDSYLIRTCGRLLHQKLADFSIEDLRIMIGQNIGLAYLIPLALEALDKNILAEGDFYPGDLLKSVLHSEKEYWRHHFAAWQQLCLIMDHNLLRLKNYLANETIKQDWLEQYDQFRLYH